MMEIAGLENSVPVRMIYVDDKSEVLFKSLAHAARNTRITQDSIKKSYVESLLDYIAYVKPDKLLCVGDDRRQRSCQRVRVAGRGSTVGSCSVIRLAGRTKHR